MKVHFNEKEGDVLAFLTGMVRAGLAARLYECRRRGMYVCLYVLLCVYALGIMAKITFSSEKNTGSLILNLCTIEHGK